MEAETLADGDVHEGVDRLVAEIDRAVGMIEHLRRENAELKQQRQALQSELTRLEEELVSARADRDRLQKVYDDNATLIQNKAQIHNKIEAMLARLDALKEAETNADH